MISPRLVCGSGRLPVCPKQIPLDNIKQIADVAFLAFLDITFSLRAAAFADFEFEASGIAVAFHDHFS
jgi:hypothetical protein